MDVVLMIVGSNLASQIFCTCSYDFYNSLEVTVLSFNS